MVNESFIVENMPAPPEFVAWLQELMNEHGWGIRETARQAGISPTLISNITNLGDRPSFETCVALASAFDKPPEVILYKAGLLPEPKEFSAERAEWMTLFDQIPDEMRETALQMARVMTQAGEVERTKGNAKR